MNAAQNQTTCSDKGSKQEIQTVMQLGKIVCLAWLCACPRSFAIQAGAGGVQAPKLADPPTDPPSWPGNASLPPWLSMSVELRGRAEWSLVPSDEPSGRAYLNRLRLKLSAQPARWLRFHLEGQDARAFSLGSALDVEAQRNAFDLRQGYFEFGGAEDGFQARAGRQELSLGDERLISADGDLDPLGQTFDAVRLSYTRAGLSLLAFAGYRVQPGLRRPDQLDRASRITGLTARYVAKRIAAVLEPYVLWKRGGSTLDLSARAGHRDVIAPGLLAEGQFPHGFDYSVEMAVERGHVVRDTIGAWAGHWEVGWRTFGGEGGPRLALEYNYASGDADPGDGHHGTFDDMYSAGFNSHGLRDPFIWRNIRYPGISVEVPVSRRWTLAGGWRAYWLATVEDGLYAGGDTYLVRDPGAPSSAVGSQAFVSTAFRASPRWRMLAGYGHLFEGLYLRRCACVPGSASLYVLSVYTF